MQIGHYPYLVLVCIAVGTAVGAVLGKWPARSGLRAAFKGSLVGTLVVVGMLVGIEALNSILSVDEGQQTTSPSRSADPGELKTRGALFPDEARIVDVTDDTFRQEVLESDIPVLVHFWADWSGPNRMMAPLMDDLAYASVGKLKVTELNTDENPKIPKQYEVRAIPTLLLFRNGSVVATKVGALPWKDLVAWLEEALIDSSPIVDEHLLAQSPWNQRAARKTATSKLIQTLRLNVTGIDAALDARGLNAPLPVLRAKKALSELAREERLLVVYTDPGSVKDFEEFSKQTGNSLVQTGEVEGAMFVVLVKE